MGISLLYIIVPTILILIVLILYIRSRTKDMKDEIGAIRTQLEKLENLPADSPETAGDKSAVIVPVVEEDKPGDGIELTDACKDNQKEVEASAYNTGKSGKIYTKEELELLIKE